jgi:Fic family protein
MRKPIAPPSLGDILTRQDTSGRLGEILHFVNGPTVDGKYLHWDELRFHTPPAGLSHEEWWLALKLCRTSARNAIPLTDTSGRAFGYVPAEPIPERLHEIDLNAGGILQRMEPAANRDMNDRYCVSSLIDEAITSSQIEGAVTTRLVAKELIRSGRKPIDRSERMILNNFVTMRRLAELRDDPLTEKLVFDIHRRITADTLDDSSAAGRFRRDDEQVVVDDMYGEVYHRPPSARQLGERMEAMCDFANGKSPAGFVHPALRSIILHFWLAYDHPFVDGNGRTARALFYWSMLRSNYWLCEYLSISPLILKAPSQYQRAFLHTETDENDLTYFLLYHLGLIQSAVRELHKYIKRKTAETRQLETELRGVAILNHRQRALVSHAIRHPGQVYTFESHRCSHDVVYETSRRDLMDLAERGLLKARKVGKTWHFTPASDLQSQLSRLT